MTEDNDDLAQVCTESDSLLANRGKVPGCWTRFRRSKRLVVLVVFGAMMLDLIIMTSIDPLLPAILTQMDAHGVNSSRSTVVQTNFSFIKPRSADPTNGSGKITDNDWTIMQNLFGRRDGHDWTGKAALGGKDSAETNGKILKKYGTVAVGVAANVHGSSATDDDGVDGANFSRSLSRSVESRVGIIVALKPATEVVANIIVGAVVDRFGHRVMMLCGFLFNTAATLGFAYASSFTFLILSRACQAIASSMSVISGLALISCTFTVDSERSTAISMAFAGLSLGVVLGYPFGSVTYQFIGRVVPFIGLAVLSLIDGFLRMLIAAPESKITKSSAEEKKSTSYCKLLSDPCIAAALLCNFTPNFGLGVFLATGPAWMLTTLGAQQWQIGCVLGVAILFQIAAQAVTGKFAPQYGFWLFCMAGMWIYAIGLAVYPSCTSIWLVIGAEVCCRVGFGIVICVVSPLLSFLVDIRHSSNYGEVFGLYTASYNIALTLGPIAGGHLLNIMSFAMLYRAVAIGIFLVSFMASVFRNPERRNLTLDAVSTQEADGGERHEGTSVMA